MRVDLFPAVIWWRLINLEEAHYLAKLFRQVLTESCFNLVVQVYEHKM